MEEAGAIFLILRRKKMTEVSVYIERSCKEDVQAGLYRNMCAEKVSICV